MREALTDQDDDEQPTWSVPAVTITQPRPESAPRVATAPAPATAPAMENPVDTLLKEAGITLPPSSDPVGVCTLRDGTRLTLRELDGEDETSVEVLMDQRGIGVRGAGQSTNLRFLALMSIDTIDGKEQAPVRHMEQMARLLKYKTPDMNRIIGAYLRFTVSNGDTAPFRQASDEARGE